MRAMVMVSPPQGGGGPGSADEDTSEASEAGGGSDTTESCARAGSTLATAISIAITNRNIRARRSLEIVGTLRIQSPGKQCVAGFYQSIKSG
jgi:hypothetical protein